jgi:maltodextrin utilization protein YvdJ
MEASAHETEVTMDKRVDDEREPTWWEQYGYKVTVFGFLVLMLGVLPLLISGR